MKENYCLNWFTASVYACDKHIPVDDDMKSI